MKRNARPRPGPLLPGEGEAFQPWKHFRHQVTWLSAGLIRFPLLEERVRVRSNQPLTASLPFKFVPGACRALNFQLPTPNF